jgi:hypothetical protein
MTYTLNLSFTGYDNQAVTFNVDMNEQIILGNFDPAVDSVDMVANYNYWLGSANLTDTDADGIYTIALPAQFYVGQVIKYKFRLNATWAGAEFSPDIEGARSYQVKLTGNDVTNVFGDEFVPYADVELNVDMVFAAARNEFVVADDFVDVAGTFNNWGADDVMTDTDGDYVYTITIPDLMVGSTIEFKVRINGDWATSEFPNAGPNRTYDVESGMNVVNFVYNDDTRLVGIDQINANNGFMVYPNPSNGQFNVIAVSENASDLTIEVLNYQGQVMYTREAKNVTQFNGKIDITEFAKGVYFLKLINGEEVKLEKIIVQ